MPESARRPQMNENLLVITTAGHLNWLREAMSTLRDELDVLVVDDATPEKVGIRAFCKQKGIMFLGKPKALGVTNSWNIAYQFFLSHGYEKGIVSNDDVRFPHGFSNYLLSGLPKWDLVGPLTNRSGNSKHQQVQEWIKVKAAPDNINPMQKALLRIKTNASQFVKCNYFNGFCFAFARSIAKFKFSDKLLFNPKYKNRENEYDLCKRIRQRGGNMAYCRVSYVFHWKSGTYRGLKLKHRDQVWR